MSYVYKVHLEVNGNKEYRKFQGNEYNMASLHSLKSEVESLFPSIRNNEFTIKWKDDDGDMIAMSSDKEYYIFRSEIQFMKYRVLYVFIADKDRNIGPPHVGCVCDACESGINGFRYKCTTCPNYDLCSNCEYKGLHPEHMMLRLPENMDMRSLGRRSDRWIKKLVRGHTGEKQWHGGEKNGHHGHGDKGHCRESTQCPWRTGDDGLMSHLAALIGDIAPPPASSTANAGALDASSLLWGLRQGIVNLLDPLGGEVNQTSQASAPAQENEKTQQNEKGSKSEEETMETEDGRNDKAAGPSNENKKERDGQSKEKEGEKSNGMEQKQNRASQERSDARTGSPPIEASWTFVNKSSVPASATSAPKTIPIQESTNNGSDASKVEDSLNKMLSMGFDNEGGWLHQILLAKEGDIEKVLDTLMPMRKFTVK